MPISPKPPWYSTPAAIESLPTAVRICNSLIESPTDTPSNANCKNKSKNIDNDSTNGDNHNNNNNNDDDAIDCFLRQDKQPVLPQQDISPTVPTINSTSPSLIESSTWTNPYNVPHQQEEKNPHTEDLKQSQHIPLSQKHPSLYGMAHSINSITDITTVQFLLVMEPHIQTLCMTTMMIIMVVQMITHTVTPSI